MYKSYSDVRKGYSTDKIRKASFFLNFISRTHVIFK